SACQEGLLLIKCGLHRNTIRFLAPLVTTDSQLEEALHIFDQGRKNAARPVIAVDRVPLNAIADNLSAFKHHAAQHAGALF
ncbi:hypothetical protein HZD82_26505, partial [Pantoea agglomerans]|uniref:hypothetical protein n=1 Tax=Enterobacter agglomerans TaxID=549 RepID=UPI001A9024F7